MTPQRCTGRKQARKAKIAKPKKAGQEEDSTFGDSGTAAEQQLSKDLWKEGVKTGLGPGKEVFIEKPKPRDPGGVPYQDDTLHPNTKLFLEDLAENNEREWLKGNRYHPSSISNLLKTNLVHFIAHDADYRAAKKDWETFVESLTEKLIERDSTIPELPAKDVVSGIPRRDDGCTNALSALDLSHSQRYSIQQKSHSVQGMLI